jgi:hypothetical protein
MPAKIARYRVLSVRAQSWYGEKRAKTRVPHINDVREFRWTFEDWFFSKSGLRTGRVVMGLGAACFGQCGLVNVDDFLERVMTSAYFCYDLRTSIDREASSTDEWCAIQGSNL